ncbi:sensor histidine kinase [Streptomyces sp. HNM0575]|uniref:sensor histidine kinase n=1 Tax=Streptomyces sp. HNM0575 TaxID=2716338 RepID=UPI00145D7875|nr:sensor histidine kinase [Streptomyces sp. HNM0575]NLU72499.1 sensor histidine kinase [Streptomyces sp. HNM0575]
MATATDLARPRTHRTHRAPGALRAPFEARAWRELLHVVTGMPLACVFFSYAVVMVSAGAGLLITFLGVPVLAAGLAGCRGVGVLERLRARTLLDVDIAEPEPVRALQRRGGPMPWMGALLRSGVSWRHLLYTLLHFPWALFTFVVSVSFFSSAWALTLYPAWQWVFPRHLGQPGIRLGPDGATIDGTTRIGGTYVDSPPEIALTCAAGLVLLLATPWIVRGLTQIDRLMVLGLLGPSPLATRVRELESDRGSVADTAAADLRRIERDLHDGAQARLVTLAMDLGLAKEKLLEDPQAAADMVDEAHGEVKLALQELRDLARGIHPAILTDRGLGPALSALATRCTADVTITVDLPQRPAQAIEGITYFTASELLQNITKHSTAHTAHIDLWKTDDRLLLHVTDDGKGGAHTNTGTGLAGLTDRLTAVDGLLLIHSPTGGPTTITAELPWRV